jgi:hypothetical protein
MRRAHARGQRPRVMRQGLALVQQKWAQIVERVHTAAPLAKGYLKDASTRRVDGQRVTLSFDPEFADSCEKMNVPRALRAVQTALEWASWAMR